MPPTINITTKFNVQSNQNMLYEKYVKNEKLKFSPCYSDFPANENQKKSKMIPNDCKGKKKGEQPNLRYQIIPSAPKYPGTMCMI